MVRGKTRRAGVFADVGDTVGPRIPGEEAEDALSCGKRPDCLPDALFDTGGDELDNITARVIEDSERSVPGADQAGADIDDLLEHHTRGVPEGGGGGGRRNLRRFAR